MRAPAARASDVGAGRPARPVEAQAFVQVVEVWVPDKGVLRHHSGVYGTHQEFARQSVGTSYPRGVGLPGTAWASGRVVVWQDLRHHLVSGRPAHAHGLDAGIAVPIYCGEALTSVLTIFCGNRRHAGGCIEVWEVQDEARLVHAGAYYGPLDTELREQSQSLRFGSGVGLPGITWQRGSPFLIENLASTKTFARWPLAERCGLSTGLGIPLYRGGDLSQVLVMLSAEASPIARAFEVWTPHSDGTLRLEQAAYGPGLDDFARVSRRTTFAPGEGLPGRVFEAARPIVFGNIQVGPFVRHRAAEAAGLEIGVGIPVHDGERLRAVVLLLS